MIAPHHPREAERLERLYSYGILDTDPERDFDEIVELVAQVCETPVALISLVDIDRLWFKARVGMELDELPLAHSMCALAVLEHDFFEVPDTLGDPRLKGNMLVQANPALRFYAGAQLITSDGLPMGTLCVLDYSPRVLTPLQRDTLRVLAHQVMTQFDLRAALRREQLLRKEVDHRVKNSLQSIASLTSLQRRSTESPEAQAVLGIVEQRIHTMSALHEALYQTDAGDAIDLAAYLDKVGALIKHGSPAMIDVVVDVASVSVSSRHAASLAVIVNEFATNSVKHGFPAGQAGRITISGAIEAGDHYELMCEDDGVGFAEQAGVRANSGGIGLKIIAASVSQIDGTYGHEPAVSSVSRPGHRIRVQFAIPSDQLKADPPKG